MTKPHIVAGVLALAAAAPASAQDRGTQDEVQIVAGVPVRGGGDACAWVRNITGFEATDEDRYLILTAIGDDRYLVRITHPGIADPDFAFGIGVISDDSQVCGAGFDRLAIEGTTVRILDMWEVAPERAAGATGEAADGWALADRE